jgi:hypothetical protein
MATIVTIGGGHIVPSLHFGTGCAGRRADRRPDIVHNVWLTQRTQLRHAHRESKVAELRTPYSNFIAEAARRFFDALAHNTDDLTDLASFYAMVGHMCLVSDRRVIDAAMRVEEVIIKPTWDQIAPMNCWFSPGGGFSFLAEFSEARTT